MTNHCFSYFFFENSPAFKVVLEFLIYMIFFSVIIWNMFELFADRRYFDNTTPELMNFADGLLSLQEGKTGTALFQESLANYSINNNYTSQAEVFASFAGLDEVGITEKVLPWLSDEIPAFYARTNAVWNTTKAFWVLNLYFFSVLLQNILEIIYYFKKTKKIALNGKVLVDMVLIGLNIYFFIYFFSEINNSKLVIQNDLIAKFTHLEKVMVFFIFIMWFKFIFYLKLTKRFGIVVKVIENMTVRLGIFMIVLCIVILVTLYLILIIIFNSIL